MTAWDAGPDRTLTSRGERGVPGRGGELQGHHRGSQEVGRHSTRPKNVLCAGETSTVRKCRWPPDRRLVAPKVKNARPEPWPRPPAPHQAEMWQHVLACRSAGALGLLSEGPARIGWR